MTTHLQIQAKKSSHNKRKKKSVSTKTQTQTTTKGKGKGKRKAQNTSSTSLDIDLELEKGAEFVPKKECVVLFAITARTVRLTLDYVSANASGITIPRSFICHLPSEPTTINLLILLSAVRLWRVRSTRGEVVHEKNAGTTRDRTRVVCVQSRRTDRCAIDTLNR